jgi:hypothetical protein
MNADPTPAAITDLESFSRISKIFGIKALYTLTLSTTILAHPVNQSEN